MSMPMLSYDQIVNLPILRQFYHLAWRLFGVNIAIISPDRKRSLAINAKEGWSPFCLKLRQMGGEKHCVTCDRKYAAVVGERFSPMRYLCWAGQREFIVPIVLDGEILAYIQCGQVMDSKPGFEDWEKAGRELSEQGFDPTPLEALYLNQRVVAPQTQEDLIALLELFGNYIADAQHKLLLANVSQRSRVEERALSYIRTHFDEQISLDDIAKAACTSKRNLTRIFQINLGTTVLNTIQELRVEKACEMLKQAEKLVCKVPTIVDLEAFNNSTGFFFA
jgi:AraC-like DNA-binding protein